MISARRWLQYAEQCPVRRRWRFLKKLGRYYVLQFDEAMFRPSHVRIEGLCSTTKIPEEIGEISFFYTTLRGPSAEHYYFSEGSLDSVFSYDGYAPSFLECRFGAVPVPITNESLIDDTDSHWNEHASRLAECLAHVTNRRANKAVLDNRLPAPSQDDHRSYNL